MEKPERMAIKKQSIIPSNPFAEGWNAACDAWEAWDLNRPCRQLFFGGYVLCSNCGNWQWPVTHEVATCPLCGRNTDW